MKPSDDGEFTAREFRTAWHLARAAGLAASTPLLALAAYVHGIPLIFPGGVRADPSPLTWAALTAPVPAAVAFMRRVLVRVDAAGVTVGRFWRDLWPWEDFADGRVRRTGLGFENDSTGSGGPITLGLVDHPWIENADELFRLLDAATPVVVPPAARFEASEDCQLVRRLDVCGAALCYETRPDRFADRLDGLRCFFARDRWGRLRDVWLCRDGVWAETRKKGLTCEDAAATEAALRRDFGDGRFQLLRLDECPDDPEAASVVLSVAVRRRREGRIIAAVVLVFLAATVPWILGRGPWFAAVVGGLLFVLTLPFFVAAFGLRRRSEVADQIRLRHPGLQPASNRKLAKVPDDE